MQIYDNKWIKKIIELLTMKPKEKFETTDKEIETDVSSKSPICPTKIFVKVLIA